MGVASKETPQFSDTSPAWHNSRLATWGPESQAKTLFVDHTACRVCTLFWWRVPQQNRLQKKGYQLIVLTSVLEDLA